jgi:hypothetical protein
MLNQISPGPQTAAAALASTAASPAAAAVPAVDLPQQFQDVITAVTQRVNDASTAAVSIFVGIPFVLIFGLVLQPELQPFQAQADLAFVVFSPVIAATNFLSVLITGNALPIKTQPPTSPIWSYAATTPAAAKITAQSWLSAASAVKTTSKAAGKSKPTASPVSVHERHSPGAAHSTAVNHAPHRPKHQ